MRRIVLTAYTIVLYILIVLNVGVFVYTGSYYVLLILLPAMFALYILIRATRD